MKEMVIVPTFSRSDLLYCCLEAIRRAEPKIPIEVFPDRGTKEIEICTKFNATHHLTIQHSYHGNSYNMLEALKWAASKGAQRVFVIEDDTIVDPSFFSWCRTALLNHPDAFAACGWRFSPDAVAEDGPDFMVPWYLSVCSCLPAPSLVSIIAHARPEYYGDMQQYLDSTYPNSPRRGSMHYEQDGLALRVCEAQSQRCVWPRRPRATHCGWYGYHMDGKPLGGSLEERVRVLKLILENPDILNVLMAGGAAPETASCETCGKQLLTEDKKFRMICSDCFHHDHPELPVTASRYYFPSGRPNS